MRKSVRRLLWCAWQTACGPRVGSYHILIPFAFLTIVSCPRRYFYTRHGQSVALQLIFAALGPLTVIRKCNKHLLLPKLWPKTVNKSIKRTNFFICFAVLKFYHKLFWLIWPGMKNIFSNLTQNQKSLATPVLYSHTLAREFYTAL